MRKSDYIKELKKIGDPKMVERFVKGDWPEIPPLFHNDWIPCSERLPEDYGPPHLTYWVTVEIDGKRITQESYFCEGEFAGHSPQSRVIAWYSQPITPAPYEGEG